MNAPTLPTDNLYKFMALTGLIVIIGGFLLTWSQAERSQELLRRLQQEVAIIQAKRDAAKAANATEQAALLREIALDLARQVAREKELTLILDWKRFYIGVASISLIGGSLLSGIGFWLWYFRVQKYLDQILRAEASHSTGS